MIDSKKFNILAWKENLVTLAVILICLGLFLVFPTAGGFQKITSALFFLFIVPVLYIKLILKKDLRSFGFSFGNYRAGIFWGLLALAISLLSAYGLIKFTNFTQASVLPPAVIQNFWMFVFYELVLVNIVFFLQEFFFKGFVLFSFTEKLGPWSILISFVLFSALSLLEESFSAAIAPSIIFSLTSGVVAYKGRSFLYSYAAGMIFSLILSSYLIYLLK